MVLEAGVAGAAAEPIPFTVIGGFLGAGKTTLVNHILTHSAGVRYALLVNDFGRINIDEQLVDSHDGQTMALSNGCICCSLADGFVKTMLLLMKQIDRFDHIVVEASGVAEPEKIMDFARLDPMLYPEGIIVLADAAEVTDRVLDPQIDTVVRSQLACASLLLLNKIDSVDTQQIDRACELLTRLNEKAPVVHCSNASVPTHLLFGHALPEPTGIIGEANSSAVASDLAVSDSNGGQTSTQALPFSSHSFTSGQPLDRGTFEHFRGQLPAAVLRAKGLLRFTENESSSWYLWQRTGKRDELVRWTGKSAVDCQLVFISCGSAAETESVAFAAQEMFAGSINA